MMSGDFTAFESPACNGGVQGNLKGGFVNNQINPALFVAPAVKMLDMYPQTTNPCGRFQYGALNNENEHQGIARADYQLSDKQSLFARYYITNLLQLVPPASQNILNSLATGTKAQDQTMVFGDTYLISPNTVNSFRMTGIRTAVAKVTTPSVTATQLGVAVYSLPGEAVQNTAISVTGGSGIGVVISQGSFPTVGYQFNDDVSMVRGTHQIGFGFNFIRTMMNVYSTRYANGMFSFQTGLTGTGYGDLLLGNVATFQQGSASVFQPRSKYWGTYIQDSWKLTPRLSVNYGVRWEPLLQTPTEGGRLSLFEQSWFQEGIHSTVYPNAPAGLLFPGDTLPGGGSFPNGARDTKWKDFAPRLGVVWDPFGNGRMTVRAAYGIFFDLPNIFWNNNIGYQAPWSGLVSRAGGVVNGAPTVPFANPWAGYPGGNPFPYVFNNNVTFPTSAVYWNGLLNPRAPYMQQWNLSIQKQIGSSWLVSANYLGNEMVHIWETVDANQAVYMPGATTANTQARRLLSLLNPTQGAYYAGIYTLNDGGTQSYNALLLSVQRRLTQGVTVQGNYTYSHCIGLPQVYELTTPDINNTSDMAYDRGNCNTVDERHIVNITFVAETPKFSDKMTRLLASGWKLAMIASAHTGTYLSVTSATDYALNGQTQTSNQRPNLILPNEYPAQQTVHEWVNPLAFGTPAPGTYGNLGADTVLGPGFLQIDLALSRIFQIREGQKLEARAEAFNFINRPNFGAPTLAFSSLNTFGQILTTSTFDPRIFQFALKYYF